VVETIGRAAATVIETVHYQATLTLSCADRICEGSFPAVGGRRRLNITRVTCLMGTTADSTFSVGRIQLHGADSLPLPQYQYLPADHSTPSDAFGFGYHSLNSTVDMQIPARQHIKVMLFLASGTVTAAFCSTSGTLDKLQ
jgi:hypothetical protein